MPRSSGGANITSTSQLADGVVTWPKIDSSAVDENIVPATTGARRLGSATKVWSLFFVTDIQVIQFSSKVAPNANVAFDLGTVAENWRTIYVEDIQGDARALIFAGI